MYHQETGTVSLESSSSETVVGGAGGGRFSSTAASACVSLMGSVSSTCEAGFAGNLGNSSSVGMEITHSFLVRMLIFMHPAS